MSQIKMSLPEFYRNKNILVTGATGFLGTGLVEKLLRSFPQINKIFLVARPKQGKTLEERSKNYFNKQVFKYAKTANVDITSNKIEWIQGDLSSKNCGLSLSAVDRIKNDVNIVFHCGATVSVFQPLKSVLTKNFNATYDLLNICKDSKDLNSFLYVSTAYLHFKGTADHVLEKLYPSPTIQPLELISMLNTKTQEEFEEMRHFVLAGLSINNYTASKKVTENLTDLYKSYFPLGIFRPALISPSCSEPFPYWVQGSTSYERILREFEKGFQHRPRIQSNLVPVDLTVNAMIASAYDTSNNKCKTNIYNFSSFNNPCNYYDVIKYYLEKQNIFLTALKYVHYNHGLPHLKNISQLFNFKIKSVEDSEKFLIFYQAVKLMIYVEYTLDNSNLHTLWNSLSKEEQQLVFFNMDSLNWRLYLKNMMHSRVIDQGL